MQRVKFRSPLKKAKIFTKVTAGTLGQMKDILFTQIGPKPKDIPWNTMSQMTRRWAQNMLDIVEMKVTPLGEPLCDEPCLLVGNHLSYFDVPVLMSLYPITFVSKKEVLYWPVFGKAAKIAGTLFLDRESRSSRKLIGEQIAEHIKKGGKNIALFPEGTTSIEGKEWKKGSFYVAAEHGFKVQAFCLSYSPLRPTAFIDDDLMIPHLWNQLNHDNHATVELSKPMLITDPEKDCQKLQNWVRDRYSGQIQDLGIQQPELY